MKISSARYLPAIGMISLLVRLQAMAAHGSPAVGVPDSDFILVENVASAELAALNEVEAEVRQDRPKAPDVLTKALRTEVPTPVPFSCEIVRAAISGFDGKVNRVEVARLIFAAVKARPEEVLSIVGVAIENLPQRVHRDIVAAALAAVPDPFACISPKSVHSPACSRTPDLEVNSIIYEPEPSGSCKGITLAEADLQEALLTGTNESATALSATINDVLQSALNPQTGPADSLGSLDPQQGNSFPWDTLITEDPLTAPPSPSPVVQPPVVQPIIAPPPTPPPVSP